MDEFLGLVKGFSPQILVCLGAMVWYFSWCLKKERIRLEAMIEEQTKRIDELYKEILDMMKDE